MRVNFFSLVRRDALQILKKSTSTLVFSLLTIALGFGVQVGLAARFGSGLMMDIYLVAIAIPVWVTESLYVAFYYGMVPVLAGYKAQGEPEAANSTLNTIFRFVFWGSLIAVSVVWFSADSIIRLVAPHFDPGSQDLAANLLRIIFLGNFFDALRCVAVTRFYAEQKLLLPQFVPILNHLCLLIAIILASNRDLFVIAIAWVIGSACMLLPLLPAIIPELRSRKNTFFQGARNVGHQFLPALLIVLMSQGTIVIDRWAASGLAEGSISFLGYGNKVIQLVLRTVPMGIGLVFFPMVILLERERDWEKLRQQVYRALGIVTVGMVPISAAMIAFRKPLVTFLLQRGAFDASSTEGVIATLVWYGAALIPISVNYLLGFVFYGLKKPWPLAAITLVGFLLTVILDPILADFAGASGIAFVTFITTIVMCGLAVFLLSRIFRKIQAILV